MSNSELPIENSTGWRFGDDTYSENLSGYEAGEEVTSHYASSYHTTAMGSVPTNLGDQPEHEGYYGIDTSSDAMGSFGGSGYGSYGGVYDSLSSQMATTDISSGTTSDSDYNPTGRTYVPDTGRRTTRYNGWTSGMYTERKEY